MTIEEAIVRALDYEDKVRAAYLVAALRAAEGEVKHVFQVLADEELGHIAYLQGRLLEWQQNGCLSATALRSRLPPSEELQAGIKRVRSNVASCGRPTTAVVEALQQALAAEEETSLFYRRMVAELPETGRVLFRPFLDIETGHAAVVRAALDSLRGAAFRFDPEEVERGLDSLPLGRMPPKED